VIENANAIVRDAMEKQDPVSVGTCSAHFPSTKLRAILRVHAEIFARCVNLRESGVCVVNYVSRKRATHGMQEPGCNYPTGDRRDDRRDN
jgi:hypothetical protein